MAAGSRIRQIGWALVLACCFGLLLALTFKVNAVKSDVRLVERRIIAAERDKMMLETEFQTRASQRQLANWNQVEFGYHAPRADQYLESPRQLAALGLPRGIGAPTPIRVALNRPEIEQDAGLLERLLSEDAAGNEIALAAADTERRTGLSSDSLARRLARPTASMVAVAEVAR